MNLVMNHLFMWMIDQTFEGCFDNVLSTISLLQEMGFVIHPTKSIFVPTQKITLLGFEIGLKHDSNTNIQKERKHKNIAAALLLKQSCSIRTLASFLGNIVSFFETVPNGKLYYRNIEQQKIEALKTSKGNFDIKIKQLSSASLSEIKWWHNHIMHAKLSIKQTPNIDYAINTDASESGWGTHDGIISIEGRWSYDEIHYHINVLELLAIELALKAFLKDCNKKQVRIFSDNTTVATYINKQGGTKSLSSNEAAKQIWEFCIHNNWQA